jgi:hypothetical protein
VHSQRLVSPVVGVEVSFLRHHFENWANEWDRCCYGRRFVCMLSIMKQQAEKYVGRYKGSKNDSKSRSHLQVLVRRTIQWRR